MLKTFQRVNPAGVAIQTLTAKCRDLHIVPQNLIELWVAATRHRTQLKSMFVLLPDTPAIYPVWESLGAQYQVSGKPAHDARLVAAMRVHSLTTILVAA